LNRFQRFFLFLQPAKTVRDGFFQVRLAIHRAEAAVLMKQTEGVRLAYMTLPT
jgi:hypothetical protein